MIVICNDFLRNTENGHIPYRRSERRLLNSLVFTSSVVENFLLFDKNVNSIFTHFKVLFAKI